MSTRLRLYCILILALQACDSDDGDDPPAPPEPPDCDDSLALPDGFCATVFADEVGRARHLVVSSSGDVFVALANSRDGLDPGMVLALRDSDGDGTADTEARFGDAGGTGIAWRDSWLYFGQDDRVVRWAMPAGVLEPASAPELIVSGLPKSGDHPAKAIQLDLAGNLLVSIGSETNACEDVNRAPGSPGLDPCPELPVRAGLWRFDPNVSGQRQEDGAQVARGVRNPTAFAVHPQTGAIVSAINGRDQLHENWPTLFTAEDDKVLPSEELAILEEGVDRGWPYCYHDPRVGQMKLAPEYGGDGVVQGRCAAIPPPMLALPAHWAPLGIAFYTGDQFPAAYRQGAFVAFHGSRFDPLAEEVPGYSVGFVPFQLDPLAATSWSQFATELAGEDRPLPEAADHRPVGVAQGPDGALYITDDHGGRIWRVTWNGG